MNTYYFRHADGHITTVTAANEREARCQAMINRYGPYPDAVTPHAPNYGGAYLTLVQVASAPTPRATSKRV